MAAAVLGLAWGVAARAQSHASQGVGRSQVALPRAASAAASDQHVHDGAVMSKHRKLRSARAEAQASELPQPGQHCRFESEIATLPPKGRVALTFDDGPEPGHTEAVVATLLKHRVPATFFVVAQRAQQHPHLVELVRSQPNLRLGSHSYSHPNFHELTVEGQRHEIDRADEVLQALWVPALASTPASGSSTSSASASISQVPLDLQGLLLPVPARGASHAGAPLKLFRYPFGNASCASDKHLHSLGYRIVGWHVDSCDWAFDGDGQVNAREAMLCGVAKPFVKDFIGHVAAAVRARHGGILLLHEVRADTVKHLDALIQRLKDEGYGFGLLDEPEFASSLR